jgi:hypothetical protein
MVVQTSDSGFIMGPMLAMCSRPAGHVAQAPARVKVTCVTPLGEEVASTS